MNLSLINNNKTKNNKFIILLTLNKYKRTNKVRIPRHYPIPKLITFKVSSPEIRLWSSTNLKLRQNNIEIIPAIIKAKSIKAKVHKISNFLIIKV